MAFISFVGILCAFVASGCSIYYYKRNPAGRSIARMAQNAHGFLISGDVILGFICMAVMTPPSTYARAVFVASYILHPLIIVTYVVSVIYSLITFKGPRRTHLCLLLELPAAGVIAIYNTYLLFFIGYALAMSR